jgi:DNA-binding PadR family transcriptional regulator
MTPETNDLGMWEIAILALLREKPMHPYQMQSLLRERHQDEILVLKRGSLYHAINRLLRASLIEAVSSTREGRRPQRTTYRILPAGRRQLVASLRAMVGTPKREPSDFLASMNFIVYLTPPVATRQLDERAASLEKEIDAIETGLHAALAFVGRIHLLEIEYLLAMRQAELAWVRAIVGQLRSGNLTWNLQHIFKQIRAAQKAAPMKTDRVRKRITP